MLLNSQLQAYTSALWIDGAGRGEMVRDSKHVHSRAEGWLVSDRLPNPDSLFIPPPLLPASMSPLGTLMYADRNGCPPSPNPSPLPIHTILPLSLHFFIFPVCSDHADLALEALIPRPVSQLHREQKLSKSGYPKSTSKPPPMTIVSWHLFVFLNLANLSMFLEGTNRICWDRRHWRLPRLMNATYKTKMSQFDTCVGWETVTRGNRCFCVLGVALSVQCSN